jgi:hypothetical protein
MAYIGGNKGGFRGLVLVRTSTKGTRFLPSLEYYVQP